VSRSYFILSSVDLFFHSKTVNYGMAVRGTDFGGSSARLADPEILLYKLCDQHED